MKSTQRIDLRTTLKIKNMLAYAAELIGVSISTFMTQAAYEKAQQVIATQEVIQLNDNERERFLALLEKPANPNAKLKAAMREFLSEK